MSSTRSSARRALRRAFLPAIALAGCSDPSPDPAIARALSTHADPAGWERLDDDTPPKRLRDPRTGVTFVRVDAGDFRSSVAGRERVVRLTRPFLLAETELTVAQWRRYVDELGGDRTVPTPENDDLPMPLSWTDSDRFCQRLGYRLPTEAEWELACRAGHGADAPWSSPARLRDHAWFNANAGTGPRPVATKSPNAYGFHDMIGNLWEWCADWYAQIPYGVDPAPVDPAGPAAGDDRALRGGSWFTPGRPSPSYRTKDHPDARNMFYGLRPARSL